jgi:MFS family permease
VPKCGSGEALYIMSAFFVGPLAAIGGWLLARAWGWLWPTFCVGVGAGLITLRNETTVTSGAKAFSLLSGVCLFALAAVSVAVSLRKRRRRRNQREAAEPGAAVVASPPAPSRLAPAGARAATVGGPDPLDKIAKLALLRDTGALTEDEFDLQKARLLGEI